LKFPNFPILQAEDAKAADADAADAKSADADDPDAAGGDGSGDGSGNEGAAAAGGDGGDVQDFGLTSDTKAPETYVQESLETRRVHLGFLAKTKRRKYDYNKFAFDGIRRAFLDPVDQKFIVVFDQFESVSGNRDDVPLPLDVDGSVEANKPFTGSMMVNF